MPLDASTRQPTSSALNDDKEFIATWPSHGSWCQIHDDGREEIDGIFLPPLRILTQHAERLVVGRLLVYRIGGWDKIWEPAQVPLWRAVCDDKGWLKIDGKKNTTSHRIEWSVNFRISADSESHGWCSSRMSPSMALAWMIASVEEHEHEVRAKAIC